MTDPTAPAGETVADIYLRPDDLLWEPTNNDLSPTEPDPLHDYDLPEMEDDWDENANRHVALMGGWCAHHPDRPPDSPPIGRYNQGETKMHPSTEAILKYFQYEHLPVHLQEVSRPFSIIAHDFAENMEGPEVTAGLRKLLEAKDCFVRAAL